jgi:hypothetical protein
LDEPADQELKEREVPGQDNQGLVQSKDGNANILEKDGGMLSQESEQVSKWEAFMGMDSSEHAEVCKNLLSSMELAEDDEQIAVFGEEHSELSKEMTDYIVAARITKMNDLKMEPCAKRKKKREQWGPILMDRQRRKTQDGVPML